MTFFRARLLSLGLLAILHSGANEMDPTPPVMPNLIPCRFTFSSGGGHVVSIFPNPSSRTNCNVTNQQVTKGSMDEELTCVTPTQMKLKLQMDKADCTITCSLHVPLDRPKIDSTDPKPGVKPRFYQPDNGTYSLELKFQEYEEISHTTITFGSKDGFLRTTYEISLKLVSRRDYRLECKLNMWPNEFTLETDPKRTIHTKLAVVEGRDPDDISKHILCVNETTSCLKSRVTKAQIELEKEGKFIPNPPRMGIAWYTCSSSDSVLEKYVEYFTSIDGSIVPNFANLFKTSLVMDLRLKGDTLKIPAYEDRGVQIGRRGKLILRVVNTKSFSLVESHTYSLLHSIIRNAFHYYYTVDTACSVTFEDGCRVFIDSIPVPENETDPQGLAPYILQFELRLKATQGMKDITCGYPYWDKDNFASISMPIYVISK